IAEVLRNVSAGLSRHVPRGAARLCEDRRLFALRRGHRGELGVRAARLVRPFAAWLLRGAGGGGVQEPAPGALPLWVASWAGPLAHPGQDKRPVLSSAVAVESSSSPCLRRPPALTLCMGRRR